MAQKLTISFEELGDVLTRPPIIDWLHLDETGRHYHIGVVPSDDVSPLEKESLRVRTASPAGRQVRSLLRKLQSGLNAASGVRRIVHGGGARFSFGLADGSIVALESARIRPTAVLGVLRELGDLAQLAQSEFVRLADRPTSRAPRKSADKTSGKTTRLRRSA